MEIMHILATMAEEAEEAIGELMEFPTQRPDQPTEQAPTEDNDVITTAQEEISDEIGDIFGELDDLDGALPAL